MDMVPKFACSIMDAIGKLQPKDNFSDFKVFVDGHCFSCHRFILNACSGFFSALLRSGMKESLESTVTIHGMSSDIFAKIYECLYTGSDIITSDNIFELWHAANLLQINFLVAECEKFVQEYVLKTSYFKVYTTATLLDSHTIAQAAFKLMIKNFEPFSYTSQFVHIDYKDLLILVQSDDLNVSSEDVVVNAILRWTAYAKTEGNDDADSLFQSEGCRFEVSAEATISGGEEICKDQGKIVDVNSKTDEDCIHVADSEMSQLTLTMCKAKVIGCAEVKIKKSDSNLSLDDAKKLLHNNQCDLSSRSLARSKHCREVKHRREYIDKLLAACRISLISPFCIETLMRHDFVLENKEALGVIRQAVLYNLGIQTFWPVSAIHRASSEWENMVLYYENRLLHAYSISQDASFYFQDATFYFQDLEYNSKIVSIKSVKDQIFVQTKVTETCINIYTIFTDYDCKVWVRLLDNLKCVHHIIPYGDIVYLFDGYSFHRMHYNYACKGNAHISRVFTLPHSLQDYKIYASTVGKKIIIFYANSTAITVSILCVDIKSAEYKQLENLDGPIDNMVIFGDGENNYLLQSNGTLYMIIDLSNLDVTFQFMTKLWGFDWFLMGAVVYKKQLYLFGSDAAEKSEWSQNLPGFFDQIRVVYLKSNNQCFPAIVKKNIFKNPVRCTFH